MKEINALKAKSNTQCRLVESFWTFWPAFQRWSEAQCSESKLSPQRIRILGLLNEHGPQIMSELRDQMGVTATNITALVDALEKDGYVARKPHPSDRRATIIEVTPKAAEELGANCSAFRERVAGLFSALDESDRKDLLRLMETLRAELERRAAET